MTTTTTTTTAAGETTMTLRATGGDDYIGRRIFACVFQSVDLHVDFYHSDQTEIAR